MATTPPSASWPRASEQPGGSGAIYAMTGLSPGLRHRQRSITPRATDEAGIPRSIWPPSPASCKPIATTASSRCSTRRRRRCRLRRRFALPMRGGASSSWPTSRKTPGKARQANRSPRARWRRSGVSTRCSRSNAPSMAIAPTSGVPCARTRANHSSTTCTPGCCVSAKPSRALPRF